MYGKSCETVFGLSYQRDFYADLKRGHNDTNSAGKDKLIKAQLLRFYRLLSKCLF